MRCQRCGFEIEPGQTFCSMCGIEQTKALRKKKKTAPKSILWVIKVASASHFKMWMVFFASLVMTICVGALLDAKSPLVVSSLCLSALLLGYELFYILVGYKNPNSTKTKAYKIKYRMCAILAILLLIFTLFLDFNGLTTAVHRLITKYR